LAESLEEVVSLNPELRIEQKTNGEIVLISPTGAESSDRNSEISFQLRLWSKSYGGRCFDSSVLFSLPDESKRSPDASWISIERWDTLSKEDRKKFSPICPDLVIELRSESDRLIELQEKMQCYLDNGIRLGWLIDPLLKRVHVFCPGQPSEIQIAPDSISGEPALPGFVLDLRTIWMDS